MTRGSAKHGPRLDEEMKRETLSIRQGDPIEARVEEHREMEGAADDEPVPDRRLVGGEAPSEKTLSLDEAEERSEIARHLDPSIFPADRDALVESAKSNHAPVALLDDLSRLPEGEFENVQAIWAALGGKTEQRN